MYFIDVCIYIIVELYYMYGHELIVILVNILVHWSKSINKVPTHNIIKIISVNMN